MKVVSGTFFRESAAKKKKKNWRPKKSGRHIFLVICQKIRNKPFFRPNDICHTLQNVA